MTREEFINMLWPAAVRAAQATGIDPRIIVAQAAQETAWGRSAPGNNYFGIKSHGKGGGQTFTTHEVVDGQRVKMKDSFRSFASPEESVAGYADFMTSNPRYASMRQAQGLDAQLQALGKSGYATDPNYAQSVGAIARSLPGAPPQSISGVGSPNTPQPQSGLQPNDMPPGLLSGIGSPNNPQLQPQTQPMMAQGSDAWGGMRDTTTPSPTGGTNLASAISALQTLLENQGQEQQQMQLPPPPEPHRPGAYTPPQMLSLLAPSAYR